MTPLAVSFHTGPGYAEQARALVESLDAHGIEHDVREEDDTGTWVTNCARKPYFIRRMRAAHVGPIVWLDADARVRSQPTWPDGGDLAYHRFRDRELISSVLWFGDTPGAREILELWCSAQDDAPAMWDQRTLQRVIDGHRDRWDVRALPESHCCIDRLHSTGVVPVIEQLQASRMLKRRG